MPSNEGIGSAVNRAPYKVLVVGGSYAGLAATLNLLDLCHGRPCRFSGQSESDAETRERIPVQITIVDERDGYYHLIGVPLAFASQEYAENSWKRFVDLPALQTPEIKLVQGSVTALDFDQKRATIEAHGTRNQFEESYDYVIVASGLRRAWPSAPQSLSRKEYLLEATKHIEQTQNAHDGVVVIGGGAVGIEMAAELKMVQPERKVTLVHSRSKLLSSEPLPDEFRSCALTLLQDAGVETVLGSRVAQISEDAASSGSVITLADGSEVKASYVINAVSKFTPTSSYLPSATLDKDGYIKINASLNFNADVPNAQYHYAAGDIVSWTGIKRGGAAMHHGHYAAFNIHQRMRSELFGTTPTFNELQEVSPMMWLAVGKKGAACGPTGEVSSGEDVLATYFGDDLGYKICYNWMRLGEAPKA